LAGWFAAWSGCRRNKAAQQRRLPQINNGRADLPVSSNIKKTRLARTLTPPPNQLFRPRLRVAAGLGGQGSEKGIDLAAGFADSPRIAGQSLHLAIV